MSAELPLTTRVPELSEFAYPDENRLPDRQIVVNLIALKATDHIALEQMSFIRQKLNPPNNFNMYNPAILLSPHDREVYEAELENLWENRNKTQSELRAIKLIAISEIYLTSSELDIIKESTDNVDTLIQAHPGVKHEELRIAYRQFFTHLIKYTIFHRNSFMIVENTEDVLNDFFAPHLLQLEATMIAPERARIYLEKQIVDSMSLVIDKRGDNDYIELDEFDPESYEWASYKSDVLSLHMWQNFPNPDQAELLVHFWVNLDEEEKQHIANDPTGFEASLVLARNIDLPQGTDWQELGKRFTQVVMDARL